jgi:hypothetical protein
MIYSDGLGKYIQLDVETFLAMDDEDFKELTASGFGEQIPDNPFIHSFSSKTSDLILDDEEIDMIIEEELLKIDDLDIPLEDFE